MISIKSYFVILFMLTALFTLTACIAPVVEPPAPPDTELPETPPVEPPAPPEPEPFPGKIAILTSHIEQNMEEYYSGVLIVDKYGADKVIHSTWTVNFMQSRESPIGPLVRQIAADPEVKALVINQAVPGTLAMLDKLSETRDDIFIVLVHPQENPPDVAARADLVLYIDDLGMGPAMAQQAYDMGAKTFVHYSFPRHMRQPLLSVRRDLIKEKCAELGMKFVDATAPDPTSDVGIVGAQQFILEDVPKLVAQYGPDTAFFATNCGMQAALIKAVVDSGAIYPQPCCPSPYHGFPEALEIDMPDQGLADVEYVISETARILKEQNMLGRVSTWPVPYTTLFTNAGVEYAIKYLNGEVAPEGIDIEALEQCMTDYIESGAFISRSYDYEDGTFDNLLFVMQDYLTYGEEHIIE